MSVNFTLAVEDRHSFVNIRDLFSYTGIIVSIRNASLLSYEIQTDILKLSKCDL